MEFQVIDITNVRDAFITESYLVKLKIGDSINNRKPIRLIIAIDVSGSMQHEKRLINIKDTLHALLQYLKETDMITLYTFNNRVTNYGDFELNEAGKTTFTSIMNKLYATNDTNIEQIFQSLGHCEINNNYKNAILFLTDGEATTGNTDNEYLLNLVATNKDIEFISIGYGTGHDAFLLERISLHTRGSYYSIYNRAAVAETVGTVVGGVMSTVASNMRVFANSTLITTPPSMIANSEYMFLTHIKPTHIVLNDSDGYEQEVACIYKDGDKEDYGYVIQEYIREIVVSGTLTISKANELGPLLNKLPNTQLASLLKEEVNAMRNGSAEHSEQHRAFFRQQRGILTPRQNDVVGPTRTISNIVQRNISQGISDTLDMHTNDPMSMGEFPSVPIQMLRPTYDPQSLEPMPSVPIQMLRQSSSDPMYYTANRETILYNDIEQSPIHSNTL